MFEGSYWITEVSHSINLGKFETRFKGSRIPMLSLPDPKDSFMSSYRTLFDDLTNKATRIVKQAASELVISTTVNGNTITDENGNQYIIDKCGVEIDGEKLYKKAGITNYHISYNGYQGEKYIQRIEYKDKGNWLRSATVLMGHPLDNPISDDSIMYIASTYREPIGTSVKVSWLDIKNKTNDIYFYSGRFQPADANVLYQDYANVLYQDYTQHYTKTKFYNPKNNKEVIVEHNFNYDDIRLNSITNTNLSGPIDTRPIDNMYTIGMSKKLMKDLGIEKTGEIIYYALL
jgi:hypothetical protein